MKNKRKVLDIIFYGYLSLISILMTISTIIYLVKIYNLNNDEKLQLNFLSSEKCEVITDENVPLQLYDYYANVQQISCRFDDVNEYILNGYVASREVTKISLYSSINNSYDLVVFLDNGTFIKSFDLEPLQWRNYLNGWTLNVGQYTKDYYTRALDYIREDIYELQEDNFQVQLFNIDDLDTSQIKCDLSIQSNYIFNQNFDLRFSSLLESTYSITYNNTLTLNNNELSNSMLVKNNTISNTPNNQIFRYLKIYQSPNTFVDTFTFVVLDTMPYYNSLMNYHSWTNTQYLEEVNNAYLEGYHKGLNEGLSQGSFEQSGFKEMIGAIINYPINMISQSFNFEIFGVNIASLILFLVSGAIVIFVINRFRK